MKEFVEGKLSTSGIEVLDDRLNRKIYPIYSRPDITKFISLNSKFYMPEKALFYRAWPTYWVNVLVIWLITLASCFILYLDLLKKIVDGIGSFRENRMYQKKEKEEGEN
jgi:hypothetical protein